MTFLAIWLFLWDDELDEPTGQHSNSFESAQKYRKETVRFIRSTMRLPEKSLQWQDQPTGIFQFFSLYSLQNIGQQTKSGVAWSLGVKYPPTASHPIIESFRVIGEALAEAYTVGTTLPQNTCSPGATDSRLEQRENFFEDMRFYISSTETEQKWHLEGEARIPTLEDYWHSRMGTSAVRPCLAVIE